MTSTEATDWLASARLDPDESDRADIRHALLSDLLVTLLISRRRGQKAPTSSVNDFLAALPWRPEHKPKAAATPQQLMAKINAAMRTLGGKPRGR